MDVHGRRRPRGAAGADAGEIAAVAGRGGEPRLIGIPSFSDSRGTLSVIDWAHCLPFVAQRLFWIYDVPPGATRGGHAHRREEEFIFAASGAFTLSVDDGAARRTFRMQCPGAGLYVPSLLWVEVTEFSAGAVCAVLASLQFKDLDYLRDYQAFLAARGAHGQ